MTHFHRTPLARAVSAALTGSVLATASIGPAGAQETQPPGGRGLDEIVVTAQKREQNLQDVAVSVQVLGETQLEELNVNGFEDYIEFLPAVSYTSNGPGYGILYMRGISSGGDGVHSGSMPSVGVYLDEQPLTTIGQILDLHIYDVARIETLPGPQGTLFGQGSQAGTLRIITNKPVLNEFQGSYDLSANTVEEGDLGYTLEGMVNIPVTERAAIRLVGWHDSEGGYIDNVPGSITYAASGITIDNSEFVEDDFNSVDTSGARALLRIDLNDNWTFSPGVMYQQSDSEGIWAHDPEDAGDLEVVRFFEDFVEEEWIQAAGTLEGSILDNLDFVYAVSTLDRDLDSSYDYSGYAEYIEDLYAYYTELGYEGYACYHYEADGTCADPSQFIHGDERFTRLSHEVRLQSSGEERFRWVIGAFTQKQVHDFDLQWIIPDMDPARSVVENANTTWQTYQIRTDRDEAYFGEATFDINDSWSVTAGIRHFKYDNRLYGFNGFIDHCTGFTVDGVFIPDDENGTPQYPCFNTRILDDATKGSDNSYKGSVEWRVTDDALLYATYSEGFRSGGINRARLEDLPKYKPDWVYNYEIGWKTSWQDGRLRFNGAAYRLEWEDFQYSFLDFEVSNLTIIGNVGQARTLGAEFDLSWLATDALNLSVAASYNDAELREPYWRSEAERVSGVPARAPKGTEMPYVPEFQATAIGRYHLEYGSWPGYVQAALSYTGDSWNNLELADRVNQDAYTLLNLSAGIEMDTWTIDLFINNVTDERAQIDLYEPSYPSLIDSRTVTNRPRSIGIRFGQSFE